MHVYSEGCSIVFSRADFQENLHRISILRKEEGEGMYEQLKFVGLLCRLENIIEIFQEVTFCAI